MQIETNPAELDEPETEFANVIFESEAEEDRVTHDKGQAGRRQALVRRLIKKHPLLYKLLRKHGIVLPRRRNIKTKT